MQKKRNEMHRLAKSVLISTLTFTVAIGGSYAWLSNHFLTEANNEKIQLKYDGVVIKKFHIYKYNQQLDRVIDLTDPNQTDPGRVVKEINYGYEITPYDSIFTERNVNTPLVFEMQLLTDDIDNLYLDCSCESEKPQGTATETRYTSNIMRIGAATSACLGVNDDSQMDEKFHAAVEYFKEYVNETKTDRTVTFLEVTGSGSSRAFGNKVKNLSCKVKTYENEVLPSDKTVTVYYVIDYSMDLVELHKINQFSLIGITQEYVPFIDDITFTGFVIKDNI